MDNLFEDLEAQFDAQLGAKRAREKPENPISECSMVEVYRQDGSRSTLIAPILGFDFIAGILINEPQWQFIKLRTVTKIFFRDAGVKSLPTLKETDYDTLDFLGSLPLPVEIYWQHNAGDELRSGMLIAFKPGVLLVQISPSMPLVGIPFDSVGLLRIDSVENFDAII